MGIDVTSAGNSIGGAAAGAGNVIAGDSIQDLVLETASATGNIVAGNLIGTNLAGTAAVSGAASYGVQIATGAHGNTIGGTTAADRNVISGHRIANVLITSSTTTGNLVEGDSIGTNATGSAGLGGSNVIGVRIDTGAYANTIGGATAGARNLISGNGGGGVYLTDTGTTSNLVAGDFIGVNPSGSASLDDGVFDVEIYYGASGNTIGGLTDDGSGGPAPGTGPGNVISSAGTAAVEAYHVLLYGDDNTVLGNLIGTDATGTVALSYNYGAAVGAFGVGNTIGGMSPRSRNIISGNLAGFSITGSGTTVLSNYIGPDITGKVKLGTQSYGFYILAGQDVTIGLPGAGNVLAGGAAYGAYIVNTTGLLVQGNLIGTDATGTASMPNFEFGMLLNDNDSNFTIGGTAAGAGNVFSGESNGTGLQISYSDSGLIQGNDFGTDPTGMIAVPNADGLVLDRGSTDITVGGTATAARNVVSGNTSIGLDIAGGTTSGIVVEGNDIGTKADGVHPLPNATGIYLADSTRLDTIGGTAAGAGNVISGNAGAGIWIDASGTPDYALIWYSASGNTNDAAGGPPGVVSGTVAYGPGVAGGQAFQFSRANPGYVAKTAADDYLYATDLTVEGWINPASLPCAGRRIPPARQRRPDEPERRRLPDHLRRRHASGPPVPEHHGLTDHQLGPPDADDRHLPLRGRDGRRHERAVLRRWSPVRHRGHRGDADRGHDDPG